MLVASHRARYRISRGCMRVPLLGQEGGRKAGWKVTVPRPWCEDSVRIRNRSWLWGSVQPNSVMPLGKTKFESEFQVRPDDIDMNQHVHGSRYFDYVLAARYDQMERCYGMSMEEFLKVGFGWFIRLAHVEYKRPLLIGEKFLVRTWVEEIHHDGVRVDFQIIKKSNGKLASDGFFHYAMIKLQTGRAEPIPEWIIAKYAI